MIETFQEIQLLSDQHGAKSSKVIKKAEDFLEKMQKENYLMICDSKRLKFNKDQFNFIKGFFDNKDQKEIEIKLRFIILCVLLYIPNTKRPLDKLIIYFEKIIKNSNDKAVQNYAYVTIAQLYFERGCYQLCIDALRNISADSDLVKYANDMIQDVQSLMNYSNSPPIANPVQNVTPVIANPVQNNVKNPIPFSDDVLDPYFCQNNAKNPIPFSDDEFDPYPISKS